MQQNMKIAGTFVINLVVKFCGTPHFETTACGSTRVAPTERELDIPSFCNCELKKSILETSVVAAAMDAAAGAAAVVSASSVRYWLVCFGMTLGKDEIAREKNTEVKSP